MKRVCFLLSVLVMVFGLAVSAHGALVDMGDGTIHDTDTQLSWLKNANTAGAMTWSSAVAWAASLNNAGGFAGLTGWRLPNADPVCGLSYNCINSEMGHLYYTELGNVAGGPLTNSGPFTNVQTYFYWSGTEYAPDTAYAWISAFSDGIQSYTGKVNPAYAWAVRPGARYVPVPATGTIGLIVIGLAGLGVIIYSRKKRVV